MVGCPCSAAVPHTAQKYLWRAFGCWFEEFGFDRSLRVGSLSEVFTYLPSPEEGSAAEWAAEAQGSRYSSRLRLRGARAVGGGSEGVLVPSGYIYMFPFLIPSILGVGESLPQNYNYYL